ncbi:hypothetical protein ABFS83_10G017800 [Erythranthe nasuta]
MANGNFIWNVGRKYFAAGVIGLAISDRYASLMAVRGCSMAPTFNTYEQKSSGSVLDDDYVLVEKLCLDKYEFVRGDVVVFPSPSNYKEKNVKRITGLPGDSVHLQSFNTLRIPAGHCWVDEGDNSACSLDSRSFGPIPLGLICGRITHVVWPPQRMGKVDSGVSEDRLPFAS